MKKKKFKLPKLSAPDVIFQTDDRLFQLTQIANNNFNLLLWSNYNWHFYDNIDHPSAATKIKNAAKVFALVHHN